MCRKILLSQTIDQKQAATFEGLLKIKESINPFEAVNSQIPKNKMRMRKREL